MRKTRTFWPSRTRSACGKTRNGMYGHGLDLQDHIILMIWSWSLRSHFLCDFDLEDQDRYQVMWYFEAISWLRHGMESKLEKVIRLCRGKDRHGHDLDLQDQIVILIFKITKRWWSCPSLSKTYISHLCLPKFMYEHIVLLCIFAIFKLGLHTYVEKSYEEKSQWLRAVGNTKKLPLTTL